MNKKKPQGRPLGSGRYPCTMQVSMSAELMEKIKAEAKKDDRNPSALIRKIVTDFFESHSMSFR